jgi:hypothetical protein
MEIKRFGWWSVQSLNIIVFGENSVEKKKIYIMFPTYSSIEISHY